MSVINTVDEYAENHEEIAKLRAAQAAQGVDGAAGPYIPPEHDGEVPFLQLERVGLADKWMQHPAQLSGGQQQRVSIARALAGDPELILADEPTGALDTKTSRQVMGFLQDINQDGTTVVMITHDKALALGAKRRTILSQFVIEAAVTSSLGGFIGIAVGFVGTSAAGKIMGIDASPTFLSVLVSFMVSVMIGLIFGYLPARRAAALNPIDALRSD